MRNVERGFVRSLVHRNVVLIAPIPPDKAQNLCESIQIAKKWENNAEIILFSDTPSSEIDLQNLVELFQQTDLPSLEINGDDLRPELEEEYPFQEHIVEFAKKNNGSCMVFFSSPSKAEIRGEIEDFFIHKEKYPLEYLKETERRIEIIRLYYFNNYNKDNIP